MSFPFLLASSMLYLSDPVDPFGYLRYACGLLAESRCLLLARLARRFLVPDLPVTRSSRCIPEPVTCLVRVIWSRRYAKAPADRRADMADDASCAFELGRNAMAYTCMHAFVRVQAIAAIEIAGRLGTWRCPFVLCAYCA